jgi:MFS family permease
MADEPLRSLLTPSIIIPIANYAMVAFLDISLLALLPLFFSTPTYLGGLGFTPSSIGLWLAMFGITNGLFQAFFFARIIGRVGPKRLFCFSTLCFAPIMAGFPIMSWLIHTREAVDYAITFTLLVQLFLIILWDLTYGAYYHSNLPVIISDPLLITGCIFLFITASAPSKNVLGAINGLGQTTVSISRAFGPALATSFFAFSKERNLLNGNAVFVILIILDGVLRWLGSQLPDELQDRDE